MEMEWKNWEKNYFVKLIWKWNGMERNEGENNYTLSMELRWNGMECSVEFSGEGNGKGME